MSTPAPLVPTPTPSRPPGGGLCALALALLTILCVQTAHTDEPGELPKLLRDLSSPNFAQRRAAEVRLRAIGEPILNQLRQAEEDAADLEVKRRLQMLIDNIDQAVFDGLVAKGKALQKSGEHEQAIAHFDKAIRKFVARHGSGKEPGKTCDPLVDLCLDIAASHQASKDYEQAVEFFLRASIHDGARERRRAIRSLALAMSDQALAGWKEQLKPQLAAEPWKTAVANFPLVVLHRWGGQSAFSFVYETSRPDKHHNDIQLAFGSRRLPRQFTIGMSDNPYHRVVDLGKVKFTDNVDPHAPSHRWSSEQFTATPGHVYLYRALDYYNPAPDDNLNPEACASVVARLGRTTNLDFVLEPAVLHGHPLGNNFHVLFQIIAIEDDYVAFLWRRLPGGRIARGADQPSDPIIDP